MNIERVKECLVGLALSDHMGDVNDWLPTLAMALDLPEPEWVEKRDRFVFAWEADAIDTQDQHTAGDDK